MIEDMFLSFDLEKIRKKKVLIASPMYGGQCSGEFCSSLFDTARTLTKKEIPHDFQNVMGESLITRARNEFADFFLRGDCDYLLFIDSDIGFKPTDVLTLLNHAVSNEEMEIICAPYPLKRLNWEAIDFAARNGVVPSELINLFTGTYFINYLESQEVIKLSQPVKIQYGGTGFMLIKRSVFEKIKEKRKDLAYMSDRKNSPSVEGSKEEMNPEMTDFFQCGIDPQTKQYLSEDYMFSNLAREVGVNTWMIPNIDLSHVGMYTYKGSLRNISFLQERAMKMEAEKKNS